MADGFFAAVKTVSTFRVRKGHPAPDTSSITWSHAIIGICIAAAIQFALLVIPFLSYSDAGALPALLDLGLVAALALAVPFVVLAGAAALTAKTDRLPASLLYMAFCLVIMQVLLFALSFVFTSGQSGASLGVLAFFSYFCARHVLGVSTGLAVAVALVVVAATFAVGLLLLALPTGQALMAAA